CWDLNKRHLGGDAHSRKVAELALQLFDCLSDLHRLGAEERTLLECAAACHDLGWIEGRSGHHKASMRMVIEEGSLPLKKRERIIVAMVARYHRKALPDKRHAHYCNLSSKDREIVRKLASIIRVADGLDYTHSGVISSVRCEHDGDKIILFLTHRADPEMEENDARKKGDLMRKVFQRDLVLAREGQ
ncbi:MAG TPA: HD domain-containing protein, partial [Methanomassiliicoccales archaeon]|nr:HD domain-containing protein [Methanomassiliicoccales archaeon]